MNISVFVSEKNKTVTMMNHGFPPKSNNNTTQLFLLQLVAIFPSLVMFHRKMALTLGTRSAWDFTCLLISANTAELWRVSGSLDCGLKQTYSKQNVYRKCWIYLSEYYSKQMYQIIYIPFLVSSRFIKIWIAKICSF